MIEKSKNLILLFGLLLALSTSSVCAQDQAPPAEQPVGIPVVIDGKELFQLHGKTASGNAAERARAINEEINKLIEDPKFHPQSLGVTDGATSSDITYNGKPIVTVTAEDSKTEGLPTTILSQRWLGSIKATVESERYRRNLSDAIDQVKLGTVKSNILYLLGNPLSLRIGIGVIGLIILMAISYSIRGSIPKYFHESYKRYTVSKIAEFTSYFICLIFLCIVFSDTLGSLAVILGAATAGVALALKELIVSMAAWLAITFGDTYRVGDRVQIAGVKGDVIDVGLVRTTLMELGEWVNGDLYTGRIVRVANGSIFAGPTYNYTKDLPFLWDEVVIKINMESDPEAARLIILKVVEEVVGDYVQEAKLSWDRLKEKFLVEDERIDPVVTVNIADCKFEFTARYPVDFRQRRSVKDEIFSGIVKAISKTEHRIELA